MHMPEFVTDKDSQVRGVAYLDTLTPHFWTERNRKLLGADEPMTEYEADLAAARELAATRRYEQPNALRDAVARARRAVTGLGERLHEAVAAPMMLRRPHSR